MPQLRATLAALFLTACITQAAGAQPSADFTETAETRAALARAEAQARAAATRARRLEAGARSVDAAAAKTAREAAALAARIQQSEAQMAAARARMVLARRERAIVDRRLAERREPLMRLTAGLQKLARRPLAVAVLRPGSLRETVYLRAMLDATLPQVRRRTAALRAELARRNAIEAEARRAVATLRREGRVLAERRASLAALETRQRLAARQAGGAAAREAERALALAERARDLDSLVGELDRAGTLRRQLAALPGPLLRPPRPGASEVLPAPARPSAVQSSTPAFMLPVAGRTVVGFGTPNEAGRAQGIVLAPADGAQVVAPAPGRVAFAGPFRGFDRIVIVEHAGGYTSLITGLGRVDVAVGEELVGGAPLGVAGSGGARVGFELRRGGAVVNPVALIR